MEQAVKLNTGVQEAAIKDYFTKNEWVIYALIAIIGIAFRWYALDMRPVHHDESQHGMFGRYYFDAPEFHYYKYNPMLHGPLLYNLYRLVYNCIGSDLWSFRAPMACLGSLYIFIPLLFRRWFSPKALLFLTAGIALGPSLIYWSRFAREDFYVLFGMISMLIGAAGIFPRLSGPLVLFGYTIQLCSKANIFVHIPIILGFLVFEVFFSYALRLYTKRDYKQMLIHAALTIGSFASVIAILALGGLSADMQPDVFYAKLFILLVASGLFLYETWQATSFVGEGTLIYAFRENVKINWRENAVGLFICVVVYCYLYSAGGRYTEGIVAGLGGEAIKYWLNQHSIERISGPFLFQFYTLTWYELPFICFFFLHLFHFYTRDKTRGYLGLYLIAQSFLVLVPFWFLKDPNFKPYENPGADPTQFHNIYAMKMLTENALSKFLGIKDFRDLFGATLLCLHPLIVTITHIIEKRQSLALWGYLFTSFFFSYSYLKEKVPWLSMYPLILGIIYLTLYFDDHFKRNPIIDWQQRSWSGVFTNIGVALMLLAFLFIGEGYLSKNADIITESSVWENSGFLAFGLSFVLLGFFESKLKMFGRYNLFYLMLTIVAVYNVRLAFITNFVKPGHASEYISQVHTTPEFHAMALQLRQKLTASVTGKKPFVLGKGESTWPITWYMAGIEGFNFDVPADKKLEDFEFVFDSWSDSEGLKKIPEGYSGRQLEFRGWWVPDFNVITFKRFLRYAINHTPWSPTGFTYVLYMTRDKKTS